MTTTFHVRTDDLKLSLLGVVNNNTKKMVNSYSFKAFSLNLVLINLTIWHKSILSFSSCSFNHSSFLIFLGWHIQHSKFQDNSHQVSLFLIACFFSFSFIDVQLVTKPSVLYVCKRNHRKELFVKFLCSNINAFSNE